MNWEKRVEECKRRASTAYPKFLEAKKQYERYSKLWTFWENRSFEAQRKLIEVKKVSPSASVKSMERHKERIKKLFDGLTKEQRQILISELKGESK